MVSQVCPDDIKLCSHAGDLPALGPALSVPAARCLLRGTACVAEAANIIFASIPSDLYLIEFENSSVSRQGGCKHSLAGKHEI